MKKVVLLTLAALLVVGAPEALAQKGKAKSDKPGENAKPAPPRPEFTTGIVASFTPENRTLKLNTGGEFKLAPSAGNAVYKPGDKVQIRWLMKGGIRIADQVTENLAIERAGAAPSTRSPTTPATTPATSPAPAAAPAPSNPS